MLVILNPNSSALVTEAIAEAVKGLDLRQDVRVEQLDAAPPAIESAADVRAAAPLVVEHARRLAETDVLIVACHSDPGVAKARQTSKAKILGVGETSMLVACAFGQNFGVISLSHDAVDRKRSMVEGLGLTKRCVAIEATGTTVLHGVQPELDLGPYLDAAIRARTQGAQVLVLGCAGMARVAAELEAVTGLPVVEPVRASCLVGLL